MIYNDNKLITSVKNPINGLMGPVTEILSYEKQKQWVAKQKIRIQMKGLRYD